MVRLERFELPTFWFVASNARRINDLHGELRSATKLYFQLPAAGPLSFHHATSMQGVGTEMGTAGQSAHLCSALSWWAFLPRSKAQDASPKPA